MSDKEMNIFEKVWAMIKELFYKLFRMWDKEDKYPNIKDTTVVG